MGRNRRFGPQPIEEPDTDAQLVIARSNVAMISERIPELWEHLYAPDVEHPAQYDAEGKEQPQQSKVRVQRMGHANWTHAPKIQRTYLDVVAELARAHWELGQNTDVPDFWTWLKDCPHVDGLPQLAGERAHTVELPTVLRWTRVLDDSLAWLQEQDLMAPERNAIATAAGHIGSARRRIEKLWPKDAAKELAERDCANKVNGCRNAAGKDRTKCGTCANYHSQHGRDRIVNEDGRAA